nr:hypothetical protein HK105_004017 [Polyrhizophydium stewartii]
MSPQAAHPALAYAAAPLQLMQHHQQHPHQQFHLVYPQQLHASPPPPAFPALSINTGVSPASAAQPFDGADAATPGSAAPPSSAATAMPTAAYHPAFGTVAMPLGGIPMGMSMGVSVLGVDAAGMPVQVQMQMPVQMVQLPVPLDDATTPTAASPYGLGLGLAGMPVNMVGVPVNVVGIDAAGMPVGVVGMPMALDAAGMPVQVQMQMPVGVVGMVPAAADEAQQPQQPADSPRSTAARARHLRGAGHARSLSASGTAAGHARPAVSSPLAAADPSASADPRAADPARPAGLRSRSLSTSAAAADGDPDAARDDHTGAFVLARHVHSPASPDSFGSSPGAISPAVSIASASQSGIPPLSPSAILPPPTSSNNSNPSTSSGNPKPFKCEMCASTFSRNHDLKRHVRIHLGIRPYRCDLCGKSFTRMDALHRHTSVRGCKTITTKSGVLGAGLDDDDDEAMSPTADGPGDDAVPASISLAAAAALKAEKRSSR